MSRRDALDERRFDEAACCLGIAARLIVKYRCHDQTAREIAEHFHRATAGLDHEALVAAAARAKAPNAPPPVIAAIEQRLWRQLVTFSGWPECLLHVEPEGCA
jgi:hypothetical protein